MTDDTAAGNGENNGATDTSDEVQARVVAQFIRDLSFECPNIESLVIGPGDNPNLDLEVNVNARHVKDHLFEATIQFKANANNNTGVIYDLEIEYGGMFHVENMPEDGLEPFLLVNCPAILFPFLRRLVADLTREGGFPPLFLDPIDFASLYVQRKQEGGVTPLQQDPDKLN